MQVFCFNILLENWIGIICAVFWPRYCSDRRDRQPVRPCTRPQDKTGSLMHLSVFLHDKINSETKTIDVSWQVIQIRSAQITTMIQRKHIVRCVPSPQSLHKLCHSLPDDVWKSRLQLLCHAVKGQRKYCHWLPDSRTANTPSLRVKISKISQL